MEIAMIGLGKMGANMTTRLLGKGHRVVACDVKEEAVRAAEAGGATGARTLDEVVGKLSAPRAVWVMVPAGKPTDDTIAALADRLSPGDIVIDGGNSNYKDTMRRGAALKGKGTAVRRCRDQRRRVGAVRGVQHDGRGRGGGGEAACPHPRGAGSRERQGVGARRAERGRALRQDGPQRDRIRPDAGVRGRVRADAAEGGVRSGPGPDRPDLAARQRGPILAAGPDGRRTGEEPRPGRDRGVRARLRRGPLDGDRGDRDGGLPPRDHDGPAKPLPVPRGGALRGQAPGRDAERVRRTRGENADRKPGCKGIAPRTTHGCVGIERRRSWRRTSTIWGFSGGARRG